MIILDHPYVSKFLEETLIRTQIPVLRNEATRELGLSQQLNYLNDAAFVAEAQKHSSPLIYTNSENPIEWISRHLQFTGLPRHIQNFKDKVRFRELIKGMYPNFYFREIAFNDLDSIDVNTLPLPCIIKPSIGFFSIGVYVINSKSEWPQILHQLERDVASRQGLYPNEVIDTTNFILEEIISGDEFAVDVYYNREGQPIILNILQHLFSSDEDVSDRVYLTSREIMKTWLKPFQAFLRQLGEVAGLSNFPMHIEVRVDENQRIVPIEVNPMRFAGWCVTDLAWYAYGINVYECFFEETEPDWTNILKSSNNDLYSMVVADLPKDIHADDIEAIDYERFQAHFEDPLELRKIDYKKHGVFAFIYARTSYHNRKLLEDILQSDLKEFLILK
jgi:hypothetical protein